MRNKEEILHYAEVADKLDITMLVLEVMIDIRDILNRLEKQGIEEVSKC